MMTSENFSVDFGLLYSKKRHPIISVTHVWSLYIARVENSVFWSGFINLTLVKPVGPRAQITLVYGQLVLAAEALYV